MFNRIAKTTKNLKLSEGKVCLGKLYPNILIFSCDEKRTFQNTCLKFKYHVDFYGIINNSMKGAIAFGFLAALTQAGGSKKTYERTYKSVDISGDYTQDFPSADLDELNRSGTSFREAKRAEFGAIQNAQTNILTPTRSIDSLFLRLPSSSELDELILSADSVAILKTIQTVATDDSIPCDQRIAYLLEVLGRIRTAVEIKQFRANQLEVIIAGALEEIKRLEGEIERLEEEKKALWLDELRDKLAKLVKELENVYNQFNAVEGEIAPKEAQVAGYEKEIKILTRSSDAERNRIAQDKLKLTETEAIIRDLENQLRAARNRKEALEASIKKSEGIIAENDKRIDEARAKIRALEEEIRRLRDKADALRARYTELEIKVERLRTDISVAEAKEDKINAEIDRYIDRINFEKKKIAQDELDDLNHMIGVLKELIPTTQKEIDRHYYYCYGEGSVQTEQTGGVVVYIVRGERFGQYIHSAYGKSVKVPAVRGDVHFRVVDVFGAPWTNKYGYPFPNSRNGEISFQSDFGCLNPSAARSGYGTISAIESEYIYASTDDGRSHKFRVGTCTRIESATEVPKVGQNFFYTGVPSGADGYNLYRASCW